MVLAALVLVVTPLAVLAQNNTSSAQSKIQEVKGGLALVAPRAVLTGNSLQLTVFLRINQEPVSDVNIWLVAKENVEVLRNELQALRDNSAIAAADKDYEATIKLHASFRGQTDNKGRLTLTFDQAGNFALVAFKKGYWPDVSGLAVREIPRALAINAPRKARPGEAVNIKVNLKGTELPAVGAGVWAVTAENIEDARAQVQEFKSAQQANMAAADWEKQLDLIALKLGQTDDHGNLTARFEEEGKYLLIAYQKGSIPGFGGIAILGPQPVTTNSASVTK